MQALSFLYPLIAIVLWAGNVIASRLSAHVIGPQAITFYRLVLAVALMSTFVLVPAWRNRATIWPLIGKLAILGFLAMCLFQSLSYLAAESTTATNMAVFTALTPLLTVLLSIALLGEAPTLGMVVGGVMSFAGLIWLVSGGDPSALLAQGVHLGDALMFVAALVYALYGVLLKRWALPLPGWQSTYMQALCALAIMFPALLATPVPMRQLDATTLPLIAYAGGLASVVLPFFWIRGVEQLGPSRCAIFMNLLPVLTAVIAVAMLHEPIRAYHLIGGGITLAGVACAQLLRRPLGTPRPATQAAE
ncbi:DMT family transporter [Bradyrhizobium sp. U87765 SZCCT0131]|uniref:DMT family transporter n=1 Tax=unclassified Bradyrhizobium TaxID=2631580 RepID=UPI001BA7D0CB|nr:MULTISPECIES: DMT family transporter [unclassified Bradyrhizobium]MBR1219179.1 DMT family transporter [Bradyrhizobium sp. U87765 SZCCT0131]MBR1261830.1 DMT family transporter [Bradyrhizobium sp. U87765 SZCCT0134]MBR1306317.1 DMT family transporter [Bradyrhizobium sp. U87765 SZCCT0110]MBR1317612.1 DMT family transporter [Bradyrhizobium sp. U87765 SZCCT0109]MBR1351314.1 DMT family transporter [Bradyrhizobium sp. U87765 SZCCT0048]